MNVVWIASYPKCGNTWMRFLLSHYLYGGLDSTTKLSERIPHYPYWVKNKHQFTRDPNLVKTHFLNTHTSVVAENSVGAIYILRHPKDVLLSIINYLQMGQHTTQTELEIAKEFCENNGIKKWMQIGYGSYSEHVTSWLSSDLPKVVVRYEALKANPVEEFVKVLEFLQLNIDSARVKASVDACSFESLKQMEKQDRDAGRVVLGNEQTQAENKYFFNTGSTGGSLQHISAELDEEFNSRFEDVLETLGYETG